MQKYRLVVPVLVVLVCFSALSCPGPASRPQAPVAIDGEMDLRHWDFENQGQLPLRGQWSFFPGVLIDPSMGGGDESGGESTSVPGVWPGTGVASYRLRVRIDPAAKSLALHLGLMSTAFKLYVNGELLATAGTVSADAWESRAEYKPQTSGVCVPHGGVLDIVLLVSNFQYRGGGIWENIELGTADQLAIEKGRLDFKGAFLFGALFSLFLFHSALFFMRRGDRQFVYLALFCLLIAVRSLFTGEYLITRLFPLLSFTTIIRVEYLSIILAVPVAHYLFQTLYPDEYFKPAARGILLAATVYAGFVAFSPTVLFTRTFTAFLVCTLASVVYLGYALILAAVHRRQGALVLLISVVVMGAAVINDNVKSSYANYTGDMVVWAMLFMVFCQAIVLGLRLTRSFSITERLSRELAAANDDLEHRVELRTAELKSAYEATKALNLTEVMQAAEAERNRLGRNIHDSIGQSVHALEFLAEGASKKVAYDPALLLRIKDVARDINRQLRSIVDNLLPVKNGSIGMDIAMRLLADKTESVQGIPVSLDLDPDFCGLGEEKLNNLYFIAAEAVNNAVRHSRSTHIAISLNYHDGFPELTIENDGAPKVERRMRAKRVGKGLGTMAFRASSIGAIFSSGTTEDRRYFVRVRCGKS
jgi:signal transduction histidine kinase